LMMSCKVQPAIPTVSLANWETIWKKISPAVCTLAAKAAAENQVSERDLLTSVRLQLPRLGFEELASQSHLLIEVERIASIMKSVRCGHSFGTISSKLPDLKHDSVRFGQLESAVARVIHERFHYVGSFRDGLHFGLWDNGAGEPSSLPVAMATLSPLDIGHLRRLMPDCSSDANGLVLSRVYSCDHAPRNSISHVLSRVAHWLATNRPDVRTLFTYVNPNLGFTGVSYRASNWQEIGEKSISYRYVAGKYASARQCESIQRTDSASVRRSPYHLLPLKIWSYALARKRHASTAGGDK
jgi:hypothetical protein